MELIEVISNRRSIRKYKALDVPDTVIKDLINSARLAPSAKNRQPWEFVVVKGDAKNEIADIMLEQFKNSKVDEANSSVQATAYIIKEAPVLILVFKPKEKEWMIGDALSIGASIENICLRATDLKLGSLWIRDIVYTQKEIAELVGKNDKELISAVSIGYQNEEPKQRPRKEVEEITEWYKEEK